MNEKQKQQKQMIGVIVVGHGNLASTIISTAESIMGKQAALETVDILASDPENLALEKLKTAFNKLSNNKDILVLVELFGSSACNRCLSLSKNYSKRKQVKQVRVVSGFNLPMIFKVLTYRDKLSLTELAWRACEGGKAGIVNVSENG